MLECPKRDKNALIVEFRKRLERFQNHKVAQNCLTLLNDLDNRHAFDDLTKFAFGLCCTTPDGNISPLFDKKVLPAIMEVTASHLADVYGDWFTVEN